MMLAPAAGWAIVCLAVAAPAGAQQIADPGETDVAATAATGQRAAENAVRQANDAFGTSIGREAIGLYDSDSVRGFSPTAAGNVRIDGLYFDQVWRLYCWSSDFLPWVS
jgi:iron complex outermembrane recepter protein